MTVAAPEQIAAFLADPANFLIGLDLGQGQFQFIRMPRQEVSDKAFLDTRAIETRHKKTELPGAAVLETLRGEMTKQPPLKACYLFHTSFCCSTLIARCLDMPGINLSLKEPYALLGLSGFKRRSKNFDTRSDQWINWRDLTLRLLSRRFVAGERILLKPSNGANNILPEILDYPGTDKVVLLYSSLDHFLVAAIGGGEAWFSYISAILKLFIRDFGDGVDLADPSELTALHRAALAWALQMKAFEAAAGSFPEKVTTLDCQRFLDDPADILVRLNVFYDLGFDRKDLEAVASGPVMTAHSKEPGKAHSPKDQVEETLKVIRENRKEFTEVAKWCRDLGLDYKGGLSNPL